MPTDTTIVKPTAPLFDEARLAIVGFLARHSGPTRVSHTTDLRRYFAWCAQHDLGVSRAVDLAAGERVSRHRTGESPGHFTCKTPGQGDEHCS